MQIILIVDNLAGRRWLLWAGQQNICFCSDMIAWLLHGDAHINLKVVDRAFYDGTL